jgi:hypothetical protein
MTVDRPITHYVAKPLGNGTDSFVIAAIGRTKPWLCKRLATNLALYVFIREGAQIRMSEGVIANNMPSPTEMRHEFRMLGRPISL